MMLTISLLLTITSCGFWGKSQADKNLEQMREILVKSASFEQAANSYNYMEISHVQAEYYGENSSESFMYEYVLSEIDGSVTLDPFTENYVESVRHEHTDFVSDDERVEETIDVFHYDGEHFLVIYDGLDDWQRLPVTEDRKNKDIRRSNLISLLIAENIEYATLTESDTTYSIELSIEIGQEQVSDALFHIIGKQRYELVELQAIQINELNIRSVYNKHDYSIDNQALALIFTDVVGLEEDASMVIENIIERTLTKSDYAE